MSHVTSYATNIKLETALGEGKEVQEDPGWEILEEAVRSAAEEFDMSVRPFIQDYYGRAISCDWGLTGPSFPRGLGVKVDKITGDVSFVSDTYGGFARFAVDLKERIIQNFTAICVSKALGAMNYEVDVEEVFQPYGKKVLLRGVL